MDPADDRPLGSYTAIMGAFGLSRLLAKDKVTQPLRAPFTKKPEGAGPSEVSEEAAGSGPRRAIGDFLQLAYLKSQEET